MLKYADTDIVFQELPDEVTLAVNITGCPCRCPDCHSKHLWADTGTPLTPDAVDRLIAPRQGAITCLSLMGGDADPEGVDSLLAYIRRRYPRLHTSWWSGRSILSPLVRLERLDYLKLGPYLPHLGSLRSATTNQRLYRVVAGQLVDITDRLRVRPLASAPVADAAKRATILSTRLAASHSAPRNTTTT